MVSKPRATEQAEQGSWRAMLTAVPVANAAARVEERPEGVTVTVANREPAKLLPPFRWLVRPPKEKRLVLDRIGTSVWHLCDGKRTVENVIDAFADQYELEFHESRVAVTEYLRSLVQRGALAMAIPGEDG